MIGYDQVGHTTASQQMFFVRESGPNTYCSGILVDDTTNGGHFTFIGVGGSVR